jgi:hypothetical protein
VQLIEETLKTVETTTKPLRGFGSENSSATPSPTRNSR